MTIFFQILIYAHEKLKWWSPVHWGNKVDDNMHVIKYTEAQPEHICTCYFCHDQRILFPQGSDIKFFADLDLKT